MLSRRPYGSRRALVDAARDVWASLTPADWREAFTHHPKIGDRDALRTRFAATRTLSETEQAGVSAATDAVLDALSEGNRVYEQRFGYIFIVCATGKTADEMLALLHSRLDNDPAREIQIAAAEQAKITAIRLEIPGGTAAAAQRLREHFPRSRRRRSSPRQHRRVPRLVLRADAVEHVPMRRPQIVLLAGIDREIVETLDAGILQVLPFADARRVARLVAPEQRAVERRARPTAHRQTGLRRRADRPGRQTCR